jgi:hypothetical protein
MANGTAPSGAGYVIAGFGENCRMTCASADKWAEGVLRRTKLIRLKNRQLLTSPLEKGRGCAASPWGLKRVANMKGAA